MDQGTTPEANIIGLLGEKKKPRPKDTTPTGAGYWQGKITPWPV